ncbi:MAG: chromate efflux transporter [Verrucomicrobiales bacterium]|nr:chromate efflux transporter [Verrucomicrobiales bacterium]
MKSVLEVFREFLILGLTSFGGPTAHIAYFRDRFVSGKKWLTEGEFADLLALCQFLPGPASSQFGLSVGWKRAGWAGAFAAWLAFTIPSALLLTIFGIGVLKFGGSLEDGVGWLKGLQIAVVAVIAGAVVSMWKTLCEGRTKQLIALVAAAMILATGIAWMQLVVIALGAIAGLVLFRGSSVDDSTGLGESPDPVRSGKLAGAICLILFFALLFGLPLVQKFAPGQPLDAFSAMYRSGSLVFGGGHVVLPLLSQEVVEPGWVSREQFLAGYGAAQAVPGPLFTFSAYLGSLIEGPGGAWGMAAICLVGVFLPAWLLVLGLMPFWHSVVKKPLVRAALAGTNAAVVGLLGAALYDPVWVGAIGSAMDVVFLIGVAAALMVLRWPSLFVVILSGVVGQFVL